MKGHLTAESQSKLILTTTIFRNADFIDKFRDVGAEKSMETKKEQRSVKNMSNAAFEITTILKILG